MPRADFRAKGDELDPLALIKLVAVMCHPADPRGRESLLRGGAVPSPVPWHRDVASLGMGARADFPVALLDHGDAGSRAGALCLAMAALSACGRTAQPRLVFSTAADLVASGRGAPRPLGCPPGRSEPDFLRAFQLYRGAAHFWAAVLHGQLCQTGVAPTSLEALPDFIACAGEIGRLAASLQWADADGGLALSLDDQWSFSLPEALQRKVRIVPAQESAPAGVQAPPVLEPEPAGRRAGGFSPDRRSPRSPTR